MARMIAIYKTPEDKDTFDKHYFEVHIPLAKKLPGLRKYDVSKSPIISTTGDSETYLIGTLHFDSLEAIKAAFASPQGKTCAADRKNFAADDKVQIYLFDTEEV
ncbi:MAG TPA: EthD family reductase [Hanamia sp.]|nr:EthD family reductase [Hanamia sp.]